MNDINIKIAENFAVDEAADFREKVYALINKGSKNFILDFTNCKFIDSTGLGVIVSIYKKCTELNGSLKLYSPRPEVLRILRLTRLDSIFEIIS